MTGKDDLRERKHITAGSFRLLPLILLLAVCMLSTGANAENMIKTAKANKVTRVTKVKSGSRIRFKKKNGSYIRDEWICYKGDVYCVKKNGNTRRKGFFTYNDRTYYAASDGVIQYKKWVTKNGSYYYMKKNGVMAADETMTIKGRKYVFKKNGKLNKSKSDALPSGQYVFVGDSRVVGMGMFVSGSNNTFIGKVGEGYSYLVSTAGPRAKSILRSSPNANIIFCFGVNDLGNIGNYINYYRSFLRTYPKSNIYFMAVNPVRISNSYLSNGLIQSFNSKIKSALGKGRYIDTYSYLSRVGYGSWDGVHYTGTTYNQIYKYTVSQISG